MKQPVPHPLLKAINEAEFVAMRLREFLVKLRLMGRPPEAVPRRRVAPSQLRRSRRERVALLSLRPPDPVPEIREKEISDRRLSRPAYGANGAVLSLIRGVLPRVEVDQELLERLDQCRRLMLLSCDFEPTHENGSDKSTFVTLIAGRSTRSARRRCGGNNRAKSHFMPSQPSSLEPGLRLISVRPRRTHRGTLRDDRRPRRSGLGRRRIDPCRFGSPGIRLDEAPRQECSPLVRTHRGTHSWPPASWR